MSSSLWLLSVALLSILHLDCINLLFCISQKHSRRHNEIICQLSENKWRWLLGAVWIYLLLFFLIVRHLHSLTYLHFHTLSTFLLNVILLGFRCMFFCILPKLWCCKKKTKFTRQSFVPFYFSFKMRRNCSCCDCLFLLRSSQKSISNHMGVKP